jgi:uncharacterized OsmC-like protein
MHPSELLRTVVKAGNCSRDAAEAERADESPKVFTRIHMHFVVKGRGLAHPKVERAVAL